MLGGTTEDLLNLFAVCFKAETAVCGLLGGRELLCSTSWGSLKVLYSLSWPRIGEVPCWEERISTASGAGVCRWRREFPEAFPAFAEEVFFVALSETRLLFVGSSRGDEYCIGLASWEYSIAPRLRLGRDPETLSLLFEEPLGDEKSFGRS